MTGTLCWHSHSHVVYTIELRGVILLQRIGVILLQRIGVTASVGDAAQRDNGPRSWRPALHARMCKRPDKLTARLALVRGGVVRCFALRNETYRHPLHDTIYLDAFLRFNYQFIASLCFRAASPSGSRGVPCCKHT
jgi:hypothetical protein